MSLAETVSRVRSGIFQIAFGDENNNKIGGGTAFLANHLLVTNNHVFAGFAGAHKVGIHRNDMPEGHFRFLPAGEFASRLVTGSDENNFDYAVLNIPEMIQPDDYQFTIELPESRRIGDPIALLGYPLEHNNLTCHQGIISSFYQNGITRVIQIDASVNAGNSGGPLIDPVTGAAFGIVTRRATGLTNLFKELRKDITNNIQIAENAGGGLSFGGLDVVDSIVISQRQMMLTLNEIERQANVGIGYAFSAEHILDEPCMQVLE